MPQVSASIKLSRFRLRTSGSSERITTHSRYQIRTKDPMENRSVLMILIPLQFPPILSSPEPTLRHSVRAKTGGVLR